MKQTTHVDSKTWYKKQEDKSAPCSLHCSNVFEQEWQNEPPLPDPWRKYAQEYHERCDKYDELLCGTGGRPRNGRDHMMISAHAKSVFAQLSQAAFANGLSSTLRGAESMVRKAIRAFPNR